MTDTELPLQYMIVYGGVGCFSRIQMVSLEKGLKEYHMQQDSIEVTPAPQYAMILSQI